MQHKVYFLITILLLYTVTILCSETPNTTTLNGTTWWDTINYVTELINPTQKQTTNLLKRDTFYSKSPLKLAKPESQRENWSTGFIAEPVATVTNIGFPLVAYRHRTTAPTSAMALTAAGLMSAISHAIPLDVFNVLDKIAAAGSVLAVIKDAQLYKPANLIKTLKNPIAASLLATTGLVYLIDLRIPRSTIERQDWHKYIHGVWHILAALLADTALTLNPPITPEITDVPIATPTQSDTLGTDSD